MGDWITWNSGECPVPRTTRVQVCFRHEKPADCNDETPEPAGNFEWHWIGAGALSDIIAYRVVDEARSLSKDNGE